MFGQLAGTRRKWLLKPFRRLVSGAPPNGDNARFVIVGCYPKPYADVYDEAGLPSMYALINNCKEFGNPSIALLSDIVGSCCFENGVSLAGCTPIDRAINLYEKSIGVDLFP